MRYLTYLKFLLLTLCALTLASCKIAVIVVEGGEVQSGASGTCVAGTVCITEVYDSNYNDTFTAVAYPGWKFVRWNKADGSLCTDLRDPICIIDIRLVKGMPGPEAVIASDRAFYLMPIFEIDEEYIEPRPLSVSKSGEGIVTSSPSGIDCGSDCSQSYNDGTSVSLSATAASGWTFSYWSGACTGPDSCTVSMSSNTSVTAVFTENPPTLKLTEKLVSGQREISLPYLCTPTNCSKTSNATILGSNKYTHSTLTLTAEGKDFVINNLVAFDSNSVTTAGFEGLEDGRVIEAGTAVEFSLVSGLTNGQLASLFWSFDVDNLGVQFSDVLNLRTN